MFLSADLSAMFVFLVFLGSIGVHKANPERSVPTPGMWASHPVSEKEAKGKQ